MSEAGVYEMLPENREKLQKAIENLMKTILDITVSEAERHGIKDVRIMCLHHQFTEKAVIALLKATHAALQEVTVMLKQKESTEG